MSQTPVSDERVLRATEALCEDDIEALRSADGDRLVMLADAIEERNGCGELAAPSPPAAPEMPEGWAAQPGQFINLRIGFVISILKMRQLLAAQGLAIVDAKDRAVLEACRVAQFRSTHPSGVAFSSASAGEIAIAELARREKP